ncbi:class I SAM-dependent methyltransferase [Desulfitobacterium sp.]|uniref:class I SAM-dependent methyltransferase n=1 Tax=Desulfitobacterium sp. TaxID=49981 RepID=UPI002D043B39|nr:methyltransferase domain-containing protein [Desulfitobacterium sp.]HVJ50577.1 methyltransferase domain-containing protein [Desulfitobacterium sp.]
MSMHEYSHHHNPEQRAKMFPAEKIFSRFGLKPNQYLADLGCGSGYFSLKAAKIVGIQGKIKAVDIMSERIQSLQQAAQEQGTAERIETFLAQGESIPLPNKDVDVALIANVLHELHDPLNYLRDTQRILRNQGELWVIEWRKKEMPMGPQLNERRSVEEWITLLEEAGFEDIWAQIFNETHILIKAKGSN